MGNIFGSILKTFFLDKTAIKFAWGALLGFSFSIAVILGTIGIMNGFTKTLKQGLKRVDGDIVIHSHEGFFKIGPRFKAHLEDLEVKEFTGVVQTEGFLIFNDISKGVLVKGVEPQEFSQVTGIEIKLEKREVALGKELSKFLKASVGDEIVLAFANGNKDFSGLPLLERYKVVQLIDHKVFQKDMRQIYMLRSELQEALILDNKINVVSLNIPLKGVDFSKETNQHVENIKQFVDPLIERIGFDYTAKPFWREYSYLIEAVETEKFMIGLIVQLIVVISIFNVLAFIIFLNEKRSRELFLFKALGMSQGYIVKTWFRIMFILWALACSLAIPMVQLFNYGLTNISLFELPGDVYSLGRVPISLDNQDYVLVFFLALVWLIIISWFGLRRTRKSSILYGLRKEFA